MHTNSPFRQVTALLILCSTMTTAMLPSATATAASTVYYCSDRAADQQYTARPEPGCAPLVDATQEKTETARSHRHFQVGNLQQDLSLFLERYKHFLGCCKSDVRALSEIEEMADELGQMMASTQANLSNYSLASRGIMLREFLPRVAKARTDLKLLRARLERMRDLSNRRDELDFEQAGMAAKDILDLEESIERDFHVPTLPGSAKTGINIGGGLAAGPAIGRSPKSGTEIGQEGVTGQNIGATPKTSGDIGTSGRSGFAIGSSGLAGPAIGASALNDETSSGIGSTLQRSTIGSSISDSTVGSSLNHSTIGSSMLDTLRDR